ncbi:MAG TPA: hypothetical protein VG944_02915 [Fimbriimonas sp.]|nr:hypothetical protein [Fimbriimonas sp.]
MVLSLLFCAASLAQQPPATVSYTTVAKPVGAVLQDLSKLTNLKLEAKPAASREIVIVSVHAAPTQAVLDHIAMATSCEWTKTGDTLLLQPSDAIRGKEEGQELAARTKKVADMIATKVKGLTPPKSSASSTTPDIASIQAADPDNRAITLLLKGVDPSVLASMGPGERVVFASNNVTSMQHPLPSDAASIVADWIAAHNKQVQSMPNISSQLPPGLPKEFTDMIMERTRPVSEAPFKALLIAQEMPIIGTLQLTLRVYGNKGNVIIQGQSFLDDSFLTRVGELTGQSKPPAPTKPVGNTPIVYSADSKALIAVLAGVNPTQPQVKVIPADLRQKLLHPEVQDPLSYVVSDAYLSTAKARNLQLVADVPDSTFGQSGVLGAVMGVRSWKTVEAVESDWSSGDSVLKTTDGQFTVIKPALPVRARAERLDRGSMAELIAAGEAKRMPSLDDICAFALQNDPPGSNPVTMTYALLFVQSLTSQSMQGAFVDWNMLRFYGTLSPEQKQSLRTGGTISFQTLNEGQRNLAGRVVFGSTAKISIQSDKPSSKDFMMKTISMFLSADKDFRQEPTELLPNGLTASTTLSSSVTEEPVVYTVGQNKSMNFGALGPQELAMFDLIKEGPLAAAAGNVQMPASGLLGHRMNMDLMFHLSPESVVEQRLSDCSFASDAQTVSLTNLPTDFRSMVDKELADLKSSTLAALLKFMPATAIHP